MTARGPDKAKRQPKGNVTDSEVSQSTITVEKAHDIWHSTDDAETIATNYHTTIEMVQMIKSLKHSQRHQTQ